MKIVVTKGVIGIITDIMLLDSLYDDSTEFRKRS